MRRFSCARGDSECASELLSTCNANAGGEKRTWVECGQKKINWKKLHQWNRNRMDQNKEVIRSRTTQSRTPSNEINQIRDGSDVELTAATEPFVLAPDWLGRSAEQKEREEKSFTFAAPRCFSPQTAQLPWLPWRDTLPCRRWSGATRPRSPLWGRWWPRATGPCPFYPSLRWFSCRKEMQSEQPMWNCARTDGFSHSFPQNLCWLLVRSTRVHLWPSTYSKHTGSSRLAVWPRCRHLCCPIRSSQ